MKRLYLLDGMALVYRAHFAFIQAPIRNSKGTNTSALYGFINTLLAILEKEQVTHLGVAFDTSAPTARHIRYPAYKAQRDQMPEELAAAIPHVKRLCRAFHLPVLEVDGFEADDIIGTLVHRAEPAGFESIMVTPDKDFAQLITSHTRMWKPGRKGSDHEIIDLQRLPEIWGVSQPAQIVDLLGLMGDASDNIPGVPGIGPKTAQKLIHDFGSIEALIARADELKGRQKELIAAYANQALLSKELATIITDVPLAVTWDDLVLSPRDDSALQGLIEEFEFRSLARRLFAAGSTVSPSAAAPASAPDAAAELTAALPSAEPRPSQRNLHNVDHNYQVADTPELQAQLFAELGKQSSYAFDIETSGRDRLDARLLGIAFCWQAHHGCYLPYAPTLRPALQAILGGKAEKIGHNLKSDLSVLQHHGIDVAGPFFDTLLVDSLIAPERRHSLDYLSEILLDYTPVKLADLVAEAAAAEEAAAVVAVPAAADDLFAFADQQLASRRFDPELIPVSRVAESACEEADVSFQLAGCLRPLLDQSGQARVFHEIEGPLLPVLVRMEAEGIAIDPAALAEIGKELQGRIDAMAESIYIHADRRFNIASPKQLGDLLFGQLGLADKAKKTKTGQYKTDEQTLAGLEGKHPVVSDILAWREASKLKSTYLDALPTHLHPRSGRLHTHFHQLVAATGRLASSDPNLQNIPIRSEAGRQIRKAFVPRPGFTLLSCDYSQIELRVMAALANDSSMIDAFHRHADVHAITAAKVFRVDLTEVTSAMRRSAKMVNFGIIYGISSFGLAQRLGIPRNEATTLIEAYFREYPSIKIFMDQTIAEARNHGYVSTLAGRRRYFPDLHSGNQNVRGNAERAAINTPIQGSAADMIKLAMIHIDALLRSKPYRSKMLLQVHDELVFDLAIEEQEELIPQILHLMKTALPLPHGVPIEVEFGSGADWLAAH